MDGIRSVSAWGALTAFSLAVLPNTAALARTKPANAGICYDHNSSPPDLHACFLTLTGGLQCRDVDACTDMSCSDDDAARRAGYTCASFPWYNGGYPMSKLLWSTETGTYACLEERGNATHGFYCHEWKTYEVSSDEYESGLCTCTFPRSAVTGRVYCHAWTCEQEERSKCAPDEDSRRQQRKLPDGGYTGSSSPPKPCHGSAYELRTRYKRREAACTQVEEGGWCREWHLEEYDHRYTSFRDEREFRCVDPAHPGPGDLFCASWTGESEGDWEFAFSDCECTTEASNGDYCEEWRCHKKTLAYFYPNLFWSLLVVILGTPPCLIAACAVMAEDDEKARRNSCCCCSSFVMIVSGGWLVLSVWLGGIGVLVIFLAVLAGISAICFVPVRECARRHREGRNQAKAPGAAVADVEVATPTVDESQVVLDPLADMRLRVRMLSGRSDTVVGNEALLGMQLMQRVYQLEMVAAAKVNLQNMRLVAVDGAKRRGINADQTLLQQGVTSSTAIQVIKM